MDSTDLFGLISSVIKRNPRGTQARHAAKFEELLLSDGYREYLVSAIRRVFALEYARAHAAVFPPSLEERRQQSIAKSERKAAREAEDAREVALAKAIVIGNMLHLAMPNGKALRDCTGRECEEFGGFFIDVGRHVGLKKVGAVMTEAELHIIAQDYFGIGRSVRPQVAAEHGDVRA